MDPPGRNSNRELQREARASIQGPLMCSQNVAVDSVGSLVGMSLQQAPQYDPTRPPSPQRFPRAVPNPERTVIDPC